MSTIDITSYILDFFILESNDPKTIVLLDKSNYLSTPDKPLLQIKFPGFTGYVQVPYSPKNIIVLNSHNLTLTDITECGDLANLPDGIYEIKMMVCPYDEIFVEKCYLKTTNLELQLRDILLNIDNSVIIEKELEKTILDIEVLLLGARIEASKCVKDKAISKYKSALKKLNILYKQVNCK